MNNISYLVTKEDNHMLFFNTFFVELYVIQTYVMMYVVASFLLFCVLSVDDYNWSDVIKSLYEALGITTIVAAIILVNICILKYFG